MNRGRSGNAVPARPDMSRYASCSRVVAPSDSWPPSLASSPAGELVQLAVEGREQGFGGGRIAAVRRRDEVGDRGIHGRQPESSSRVAAPLRGRWYTARSLDGTRGHSSIADDRGCGDLAVRRRAGRRGGWPDAADRPDPASRHDPHDRAAGRRRGHPPRHRRSPADAAGERRSSRWRAASTAAPRTPPATIRCSRRLRALAARLRAASDGCDARRAGGRSRAAARRAGDVARRRLRAARARGAADAGDPRSARRGAPLYGAAVDARGGARVDPGAPGPGPAAARRRCRAAAGRGAVPAHRRRPLAAAGRARGGADLAGAWPASRPTRPSRCCWPCCAATAAARLHAGGRRHAVRPSSSARCCRSRDADVSRRVGAGARAARRPARRRARLGPSRAAVLAAVGRSGVPPRPAAASARTTGCCRAAACSGRSSSATARSCRAKPRRGPRGTIRRRCRRAGSCRASGIAAPADQSMRYEQVLFASRWLAGGRRGAGGRGGDDPARLRALPAAPARPRSPGASTTSPASPRWCSAPTAWRRPPPTGAATRRWCAGRARSSSSITWRASARSTATSCDRALDALAAPEPASASRGTRVRALLAGLGVGARRRRSAVACRSRTRWWRG